MHVSSPVFSSYFSRPSSIVPFCIAMLLSSGSPISLLARDQDGEKPAVGSIAKDFSLKNLDGKGTNLSDSRKTGPVVVVVLRGFPGYQCPVCTQQVSQLIASAKKFSEASTQVLLIYPGGDKNLTAKGKEFMKKSTLPEGFQLLIDSDYVFTKDWNLRWDAPGETAYPSTFVLDREGKIQYAKISRTHGDRAPINEVVEAVKRLIK